MPSISVGLFIIGAVSFLTPVLTEDATPYDPDVDLNTIQVIRRHGYPAETHVIQTSDGYLLSLHRIPHRQLYHKKELLNFVSSYNFKKLFDLASQQNSSLSAYLLSTIIASTIGRIFLSTTITTTTTTTTPRPTPKPAYNATPVFLQHGLLGSSFDWIVTGPGKALAYLLADAGYDVWLGNARGNTYSRAHISLPTDSKSAFWNFSFHEMATNDLPAAFEYVLNVTGQRQLSYIGHSMGTTMFFAMAAQRPDIAAKVSKMFALAPVAYVNHIKSPIRYLSYFTHDIEFLFYMLGTGEFLPQNKVLHLLSKYGCELYETERKICENIVFVLCGYDAQQFDEKLLPVTFSHTPAGTSTKTLVHYAQMITAGKFQQFDYGTDNQLKYNSTVPPIYNLTKIQVPITMFYGQNDWLATPTDVGDLYNELKCKKAKYVVPFPKFNHLDFLIARDAKKLLYNKLLKLLSTL